MSAFGIIPSDHETVAAPAKGGWSEDDVRRAVNVAQEAGLTDYRVEIGPDGTISIVVGAASQPGNTQLDPKDFLNN